MSKPKQPRAPSDTDVQGKSWWLLVSTVLAMVSVGGGPAAPVHNLGPDDDWVDAPELGMLAKVFNQDVVNMPEVQRGLKAMKKGEVIFANYGETKPRHFHKLLKEWITKP